MFHVISCFEFCFCIYGALCVCVCFGVPVCVCVCLCLEHRLYLSWDENRETPLFLGTSIHLPEPEYRFSHTPSNFVTAPYLLHSIELNETQMGLEPALICTDIPFNLHSKMAHSPTFPNQCSHANRVLAPSYGCGAVMEASSK